MPLFSLFLFAVLAFLARLTDVWLVWLVWQAKARHPLRNRASNGWSNLGPQLMRARGQVPLCVVMISGFAVTQETDRGFEGKVCFGCALRAKRSRLGIAWPVPRFDSRPFPR